MAVAVMCHEHAGGMLIPDDRGTMNRDDQQRQDLISSHCFVVKRDIAHAQVLLQDAVDKLLLETLAMRRDCDLQRQAAHSVHPEGPCAQTLRLGRMIEERTNANLLHLQFQDMVTQVLDHVKAGLDALETLMLAAGNDESVDETMNASGPTALRRRSNPVKSRDMRAGDVDLF